MIGPYPINISVLVPIGILFLILYSSYRVISTHQQPKQNTKLEDEKKKLLISLGSGGHTTEMLLMLQTLQVAEFSDRFYYISSGDSLSHQKLLQFESTTSSSPDSSKVENNQARVRVVARARNVMQSWWSTPFTASISLVDAVRLVYRDRPDLMICNGPGTCVMLVLAVLSLRVSLFFLTLSRHANVAPVRPYQTL